MPVASRKARRTAAAESEPDAVPPHLPYTTQWHRDHGRGTRRDKAIKQQLLTPREEQAIVDFILRADRNGFPARVKDLHHYAADFLRGRAPQRRRKTSSKEQGQVPAKDWPQAFCKRHPELKVARLRALDWRRHEKNIYKKIVNWFDLMRAQLRGGGRAAGERIQYGRDGGIAQRPWIFQVPCKCRDAQISQRHRLEENVDYGSRMHLC
jgi:hypothetical protein